MPMLKEVRRILSRSPCFLARGGLLFLFALSHEPLRAQAPAMPDRSSQAAALLKKLGEDDVALVDVQCAIDLGLTAAIPLLQERYAALHVNPAATSEEELFAEIVKSKLAAALLRLGAPDRGYWDLLSTRAQVAVDRDFPPMREDRDKQQDVDGVSPEFLAWAKAQGLSPEKASFDAFYGDPASLMEVAATKDPRALPLLREGLRSRSPILQLASADGLAALRDKASLPLLLAAVDRPGEVPNSMASALVYFDDPEAQRIAAAHLSPAVLKEALERRARGCTPSSCWSNCVGAAAPGSDRCEAGDAGAEGFEAEIRDRNAAALKRLLLR